MRIIIIFSVVLLAAFLSSANPQAPQITNVAVTSSEGGTLNVSYDLDEDAVVTMAISIGGTKQTAATVRTLVGDVNRKVAAGNGRSIVWKAYKDCDDLNVAAGQLSVELTAWTPIRPPDYMVCDLRTESAERVRYYASSNDVPGGVTNGCNEIFLHRSCSEADDLAQMPYPVVEELLKPSRFFKRAKRDHSLRAF